MSHLSVGERETGLESQPLHEAVVDIRFPGGRGADE